MVFDMSFDTPRARWMATAIALVLPMSAARAQTDYYNTDAGRPISIEDAYPVEYRALELQVAPLRLERTAGIYTWAVAPEIAVGILPRTQLEIGFPVAFVDLGAGEHDAGLAGIELSVLHNLNAETSIPALALAADVHIPAGTLGPDKAYPSLKAIATKTFPGARLHLNGRWTFGERIAHDDAHADPHASGETSQWMAGLAVDRTFPLESLLLTAEVLAHQPLVRQEPVVWDVGAGARYQLGPRVAADLGGGYHLSGHEKGWYTTIGAALSIGLPWSPKR